MSKDTSRPEATTLDHPCEAGQREHISCTVSRCKWHSAGASDAELHNLLLLARDSAPYLMGKPLCVCLACLAYYCDHCGFLTRFLVEAIERYMESSINIVDHGDTGRAIMYRRMIVSIRERK